MKFTSQLIVLAAALMTAVSADKNHKPSIKPVVPLHISPAAAFEALKKKQKMVLFLGTQWCPYTKSLQPKWHKVQDKYSKNPAYKKVKFLDVDCGRGNACQSLGVKNVPTVRYYTALKKFVEYTGPDSEKDLNDWIAKVVKVSPGHGTCTKPILKKPTAKKPTAKKPTAEKPTVKPGKPATKPTYEQNLAAKFKDLTKTNSIRRVATLMVGLKWEISKLRNEIKTTKDSKHKKVLARQLKVKVLLLRNIYMTWKDNEELISILEDDNVTMSEIKKASASTPKKVAAKEEGYHRDPAPN